MSTKKQSIVDTATRLFAKNGYHAVGIDRIIKESGVAKMTLFRHFATKNDLISEVLSQRARSALQSMADSIATRQSSEEQLHELFDWHHRWFTSHDFSGCMFVGALSEFHEDSGDIVRISVSQKQGLRSFVQGLLQDLVPSAMVEPLARQIVMILDGAIIAATSGDRDHAAGEAWEAAERLIAAYRLTPQHRETATLN
ncbi:TetR/AcrR family transcriptional regulator [Burkholderia gladioli]|uniref:TetR/AcrR family transcriptional regulator n=1 Tax=Burkholderia gladioli TaxID=28095 RepID=UPI00163E8FE5|nr:TetR/AcrR family transcriptional regulator [Burkholderia gladioli]